MHAWRSWAASAPSELREMFDAESLSCLREIRRDYPANCGPDHGLYQEMKGRSSLALRQLAEHIQTEHDDDAVD